MNINLMKDFSELIFYNINPLPIYIGKGILSSFSNLEALCHWHSDVEFLMPVKGHISYKVNGNTFLLQEGDGIFVNSRQMHYGFSADETDCEYICMVFDPSMLFGSAALTQMYLTPVMESSMSELILAKDQALCKTILEELKSVYALFEKQSEDLVIDILSSLLKVWKNLFILADSYLNTSADKDDLNLFLLKKMLSHIYDNFENRLSLKEIAASGGVCTSKCCRIFRHYLNRSPNDYLNSYRLEKSIVLLREKKLSISEIAYSCGFSSPSYFSEIFLKSKGCSPTEFRQGF